MMNKINLLFVTLFGIGYLKFAPGTLASLITTIILYLIFLYTSQHVQFFLFVIIVCMFFYSLTAIKSIESQFKKKDPREIVIDEVVGQSIPIYFFEFNLSLIHDPSRGIIENGPNFYIYEWSNDASSLPWVFYLWFFLLFRFFDIVKIFPCNIIDKKMKNSLGVMLDDIIAGIYVIIFIALWLNLTKYFDIFVIHL